MVRARNVRVFARTMKAGGTVTPLFVDRVPVYMLLDLGAGREIWMRGSWFTFDITDHRSTCYQDMPSTTKYRCQNTATSHA